MRHRTVWTRWLLGAVVLGFGLSGPVRGTPPVAGDLARAEAAVKKAKAEEEAAQEEWTSREMARSATREIARAERKRAEGALQDVLGTREVVRKKEAAAKAARQAAADQQDAERKKSLVQAAARADAELAKARNGLEQKITTMRAVVERLIADALAGEKAARELMVSENSLRDRMARTRAAERAVLEPKSKAAEKAQAEAARQALQELTAAERALRDEKDATGAAERAVLALKAKATGKARAEAARQAVHENQALTAWEIQQWAGVQKSTLQQIVEMTGHASRIASKLAGVEPDPERKKTLEQFAKQETELEATAQKEIAEKDAEIDAAVAKIYPLRVAAMGGLKPLAPECWDYAKARHLLLRAGFGGTPQEVDKLCRLGLYKAVDQLVEFYRQPSVPVGLDVTPPLAVDPLEAKLRGSFIRSRVAGARRSVERGQVGKLRRWWLKRMVESPRPLQEKLALFWHGLCATQDSVVQNSYTLYRQNQLYREHAAGNYGAILYGIVHDPAMIRYLDNNRNVKGKPNENLAREILELFSMGVDQGYTEEDIVQAARALTGYTFDHNTGGFRYVHSRHDTGDKTLFGKTGPWTGDDLVRLILEQPATSRFIARRLFEYFARRQPEPETVESLATVLRTNNYELEPVLKNLFLSEELYGERVTGSQIKSPVELVVGTLRELGVKQVSNYGVLDGAIQQIGQQLFEPPDVKGWRYGRSWISSNRMFVRYNVVANLIKSVPQPGGRQGVDVVALVQNGGCKSAAGAVDYLAKTCLVRPLSPEKQKALVDYLGHLPPHSEWTKRHGEINERLQSVLTLMLSMPEYQMI